MRTKNYHCPVGSDIFWEFLSLWLIPEDEACIWASITRFSIKMCFDLVVILKCLSHYAILISSSNDEFLKFETWRVQRTSAQFLLLHYSNWRLLCLKETEIRFRWCHVGQNVCMCVCVLHCFFKLILGNRCGPVTQYVHALVYVCYNHSVCVPVYVWPGTVCMRVCHGMCVWVWRVCVCVCVRVCVCLCVRIYTHINVYIYMYIFVYIFVYRNTYVAHMLHCKMFLQVQTVWKCTNENGQCDLSLSLSLSFGRWTTLANQATWVPWTTTNLEPPRWHPKPLTFAHVHCYNHHGLETFEMTAHKILSLIYTFGPMQECRLNQNTSVTDSACTGDAGKSCTLFFDGYCATAQGSLDWFEVDFRACQACLFRLICVLTDFWSPMFLSCSPVVRFWTPCTASPTRWECL